jgi:hypothetical protein
MYGDTETIGELTREAVQPFGVTGPDQQVVPGLGESRRARAAQS